MYNHLTLPVFTIIEQVTRQNANVFPVFVFFCMCVCVCVQTSTPRSVAFQMPHRTLIFLMFYPLFLLLAILCFDIISRRILFTKCTKTLRCVFSIFFEFSPVCMIKTFCMTFIFCHLNTKFCSRGLPQFLCLICSRPHCDTISQAVPVIEMLNRLENPIKPFCYKNYNVWILFNSRAIKCDTRRGGLYQSCITAKIIVLLYENRMTLLKQNV